jgi:hypothetical protein
MTEKKKTSPKKKIPEGVLFALKLFAVILLGFSAGLVFRRSVGIVSMFPIAFALCGLASCIDIKPSYKLIIFPASVFILNTVETSDSSVVLTFTALCLLANLFAEYSANAFRRKQKRFFVSLPIGAIVCVALSFIVIGNPFTAISSNNRLKSYVKEFYPETENAYLGDFEFSTIYYNRDTKTYSYDAICSAFPTESAEISIKNGVIRDSFKELLYNKIKSPYEVEFTAYLRKIFPTDSFTVECVSVVSLPNENLFLSKEGELTENASYEIYLGGIQTADEMISRVRYYISLLDRANAQYDEITFTSGTGPFVRRCVKIDRMRQKFDFDLNLEYIPVGLNGSFSDFEFPYPKT